MSTVNGYRRLTKKQIDKALEQLAKANTKAHIARSKVADHCKAVYGYDPADVDNDEFIDTCDGGAGVCAGMSADVFHDSMIEAMEMQDLDHDHIVRPS